MKVIVEATVKHWWIEKRPKGCHVMVRFEGTDPEGEEFKFEKEYAAKTIDDAVAFLEEQLAG